MRRIAFGERPDWRGKATEVGFTFYGPAGEPYWDETHAYVFSLEQIEDHIERAVADLHALALDFVDRAVRDERTLERLGIPRAGWDAVTESWHRDDPSLYGRFDFAYDGSGPPKLLEYNADTPTALFETGAFQWHWLEDGVRDGRLPAGADQFNSVHERLTTRFATIAAHGLLGFAADLSSAEDLGTVAYLADCASQGGCDVHVADIAAIGLGSDNTFRLPDDRPLATLFKLYPWEWAFRDPFGRAVHTSPTRFLEPPWKAILSSKGILPALWSLAPGHPNLLPAFHEDDHNCAVLKGTYARKPLLGREGCNQRLVRSGETLEETGGPYGREVFILQALADLPCFDGRTPVLGAWVVGDAAAGLCIREGSLITDDRALFVPHLIDTR